MSQTGWIGLDIGTTGTKAVLFSQQGEVLAESERTYPLHHPYPGWAEQDPDQIEQAAREVLKDIVSHCSEEGRKVQGVGLSSAMHSLICVDRLGQPLSPSITWADGRSLEQAIRLKQAHEELYLKTGTPHHPMSPLAKLMWMRDNRYPAYQQANAFISIKEYILFKWFGVSVVDYAIASATGLFNIHKLNWEEEALELAGISIEQLSQAVPPTCVLQGLKDPVARDTGLPADTPFVIGASDGPLANLGIGAIDSGEMAVTIGTSGAIRQLTPAPHLDKKQEVFCYAFTDGWWVMGGATNNGGIVLRWLKDMFQGDNHLGETTAYEELLEAARHAPPGANGLLFLPFINGERAPYWDANARGTFVGLTGTHQKEEIIRAALEGVIFNLYSVAQSLQRLGVGQETILASGGFARSPLWLQLLADIFGVQVKVPKSYQSSAWGAAWMAAFALGEVDTLENIKQSVQIVQTFDPDIVNHQHYQTLYTIYRHAYPALKGVFDQLSAYQRQAGKNGNGLIP